MIIIERNTSKLKFSDCRRETATNHKRASSAARYLYLYQGLYNSDIALQMPMPAQIQT